MSKNLVVRIDGRLKRDYMRACQLLGTTQSAAIHRAVVATIRRAQAEFPQNWGLLSDYEELIVEAIEERHQELEQIVEYTRLQKEHVQQLLASLCERGIVAEGKRSKTELARGASQKVFNLKAKIRRRDVGASSHG